MDELVEQARFAIRSVQSHIHWPGRSADHHLIKRKNRRHLPVDATLFDYHAIIQSVVSDLDAEVYVYWHGNDMYVAVVAIVNSHSWLVMCDLSGQMEERFSCRKTTPLPEPTDFPAPGHIAGGNGMNDLELLLSNYEVDVDFPDVSGMEHLQMLINRSLLHQAAAELSQKQQKRLASADEKLLSRAFAFLSALDAIANLREWRDTQNTGPDEWWWYLDVLAQLPAGALSPAATLVPA